MGFTLIELLVSIAVLAIIGGAVPAAYAAGLVTLRPGGPQTRLLAAHDLMTVEQDLGKDGARASCVQLPPSATKYGSCAAGFHTVVSGGGCPAADVCFGWPVASGSTWSCHVADYLVGSNTIVTRTEYDSASSGQVASGPLAREVPVNFVAPSTSPPGSPAWVATVSHPADDSNSNGWLRSLQTRVTVTGSNLLSGPGQDITIHPVATDPNGASAAITSAGKPC